MLFFDGRRIPVGEVVNGEMANNKLQAIAALTLSRSGSKSKSE